MIISVPAAGSQPSVKVIDDSGLPLAPTTSSPGHGNFTVHGSLGQRVLDRGPMLAIEKMRDDDQVRRVGPGDLGPAVAADRTGVAGGLPDSRSPRLSCRPAVAEHVTRGGPPSPPGGGAPGPSGAGLPSRRPPAPASIAPPGSRPPVRRAGPATRPAARRAAAARRRRPRQQRGDDVGQRHRDVVRRRRTARRRTPCRRPAAAGQAWRRPRRPSTTSDQHERDDDRQDRGLPADHRAERVDGEPGIVAGADW